MASRPEGELLCVLFVALLLWHSYVCLVSVPVHGNSVQGVT